MRADNFKIQDLIDNLYGTCDSLEECISTFYPDMHEEDLTPTEMDEIQKQIFLCDDCGWWSGLYQKAIDMDVCDDCFNNYL